MSTTDAPQIPPVVFILGGPGSGKGTQCEQLLAEVAAGAEGLPKKLYHVNVGGILRGAQTEYRRQIEENCVTEAMAKAGPVLEEMLAIGQILPSWVTVTLLKEELNRLAKEVFEEKAKNAQHSAGILIDGFPRSQENLQNWESIIGVARRLIVLDVPNDVMTDRIIARGKHSGREDDQDVAIVQNRLRVFESQTGEVMREFTITGSAEEALANADVARIGIKLDGNRPVAEVTPDFMGAFKTLWGKL